MVAMAWGVLSVAACGDDAAPASPADDEPAGEVLQIEGKVTAEVTSGGDEATRVLAVGDKVFARDTIVTAADATVTIRLFHNNAEWTLGAGKRREVRLSAAWKAPKREGEDLFSSGGNEQTTAAGRHAEKEAASTRATAATEAVMEKEAPPGGEPVESKEKASREAPRRASRAATESDRARRAEIEKKVAEKGVLKVLGSSSGSSGGSVSDVLSGGEGDLDKAFDGVGGLGLKGTGRGGGGTGEGTVGVGVGTIGKGGGSGAGRGYGAGPGGDADTRSAPLPKLSLGRVSATGSLGSEVVRRLLRRQVRALQHCYQVAREKDESLAGKLAIEFAIDGKGAVTKVSVGGDAKLAAAVRACVTARLRKVLFPASSDGKETSVVAQVTLSVAD